MNSGAVAVSASAAPDLADGGTLAPSSVSNSSTASGSVDPFGGMSPAGSTTADTAGWPIEDATTSDFYPATPAPSDATGLPIAETLGPSSPLATSVQGMLCCQKEPQPQKAPQPQRAPSAECPLGFGSPEVLPELTASQLKLEEKLYNDLVKAGMRLTPRVRGGGRGNPRPNSIQRRFYQITHNVIHSGAAAIGAYVLTNTGRKTPPTSAAQVQRGFDRGVKGSRQYINRDCPV